MEKMKDRIKRKFNLVRKAIEDDKQLYSYDGFSIEPISGNINPNSELIVTIMSKPEGPMQLSGQA